MRGRGVFSQKGQGESEMFSREGEREEKCFQEGGRKGVRVEQMCFQEGEMESHEGGWSPLTLG